VRCWQPGLARSWCRCSCSSSCLRLCSDLQRQQLLLVLLNRCAPAPVRAQVLESLLLLAQPFVGCCCSQRAAGPKRACSLTLLAALLFPASSQLPERIGHLRRGGGGRAPRRFGSWSRPARLLSAWLRHRWRRSAAGPGALALLDQQGPGAAKLQSARRRADGAGWRVKPRGRWPRARPVPPGLASRLSSPRASLRPAALSTACGRRSRPAGPRRDGRANPPLC